MPSQLDLDQGGTVRKLTRTYLGPSIGWAETPGAVLLVISPGTYSIDPAVTLVTVNVGVGSGPVTLNLPKIITPTDGSRPGLSVQSPLTIVDVGGFAQANPITINPAAGQTIMGLSSAQIGTNFGALALRQNLTEWIQA